MYENGGCLDGGIPEEVFYEFHNRFEIRKFNRKIKQIYIDCPDDDSEVELCIGRTNSVNMNGNFTEEDLEIILKALKEVSAYPSSNKGVR